MCKDSENDWMMDDKDDDGDPIRMYHVVFLGKAKSWAWIPDDKVEWDTLFTRLAVRCSGIVGGKRACIKELAWLLTRKQVITRIVP